MDELSDLAVIEALQRQLSVAATKQAVAAGNLANANTPGYQAREVRFDDVLDANLARTDQAAATHPGHIRPQEPAVTVRDADGVDPKRDGNTVQIDQELLTMGKASGEFARAQTALSAKFRLVRYAINEGQ